VLSGKNPVLVEAGLRGARRRWGATPRIIRLDAAHWTPEEREALAAFAELGEARKARAPGATK